MFVGSLTTMSFCTVWCCCRLVQWDLCLANTIYIFELKQEKIVSNFNHRAIRFLFCFITLNLCVVSIDFSIPFLSSLCYRLLFHKSLDYSRILRAICTKPNECNDQLWFIVYLMGLMYLQVHCLLIFALYWSKYAMIWCRRCFRGGNFQRQQLRWHFANGSSDNERAWLDRMVAVGALNRYAVDIASVSFSLPAVFYLFDNRHRQILAHLRSTSCTQLEWSHWAPWSMQHNRQLNQTRLMCRLMWWYLQRLLALIQYNWPLECK